MLPQVPIRREGEDYADQILSKAVKAGRRTYFFDVRATRGDDYFLTIAGEMTRHFRELSESVIFSNANHYLCHHDKRFGKRI